FLESSVSGLAEEGKVVSVRLALFAEMVKGKPWAPATLDEVGGAEGIGTAFLEETFGSRAANPKHRQHEKAVREILKALLPDIGSDIKGHMRSHAELLEASGYSQRRNDFDESLRILDAELRLITPTEGDSDSDEANSKCYQLAHDYLVPSLREWLTRKQRETWRGRARLRLAERAAFWNLKRERRRLLSFWEDFTLLPFVRWKELSETEQTFVKSGSVARKLQFLGLLGSMFLVVGLILFSLFYERNRFVAEMLTRQLLENDVAASERIADTLLCWRENDFLRAMALRGVLGAKLTNAKAGGIRAPGIFDPHGVQVFPSNPRIILKLQVALFVVEAEELPALLTEYVNCHPDPYYS
ncbi:MAG: hypothetical protein N2C14_08735, partial [Planctomycetales bacterium]